MKKHSLDDRYALYCDIIAGLIGGLLLLLFLWQREVGPTLIDNPCAPGYRVVVNGEFTGYCTNNGTNYRGSIH